MATASKAPAKKSSKSTAKKAPQSSGPVENAAAEKLGTTRAESVPVPKGVEDVKEFNIEIVDNAHAIVTLNGKKVRLGQSDVSDARKLLDAAFIQLH